MGIISWKPEELFAAQETLFSTPFVNNDCDDDDDDDNNNNKDVKM